MIPMLPIILIIKTSPDLVIVIVGAKSSSLISAIRVERPFHSSGHCSEQGPLARRFSATKKAGSCFFKFVVYTVHMHCSTDPGL